MKSSKYRAVAALLGIGFFVVFASRPSPRTVVGAGLASAGAQQGAPLHQPRQVGQVGLLENYGKLPLSFEANRGQTDPSVKFPSRGSGYTLFLTGDEAVLSLKSGQSSVVSGQLQRARTTDNGRRTADDPVSSLFASPESLLPSSQPRTPSPESRTLTVLCLKMMGANRAAKVTGLDELP